MQLCFLAGGSISDAIFIIHVRQCQGKFYAINKTLYMVFVHLEKAFNCLSRRVIW